MTIKYNLLQTLNGKQIMNTLHYVDDPTGTSLQPDEVAVLIAQAFETHVKPLQSDAWSLNEITYVDPDAGGGQPAVPAVVPALPIVGELAVVSMSNRVSALINWKSAENAPWKGRTNISGMYENGMEGANNFDLSVRAGMNALATALITLDDGIGGKAALVLRSTKSNTLPVGTTSRVTTGQLNPVPKTIRSRG